MITRRALGKFTLEERGATQVDVARSGHEPEVLKKVPTNVQTIKQQNQDIPGIT